MTDQNFKPGSDDNAKQHFANAALEELVRIGKRDDEAFLSRMDSLLDEVDSETKVKATEFTPMPRPGSRRNATWSILAAAVVIICLLPVFLLLQSKNHHLNAPSMVVKAETVLEKTIEQNIRPGDFHLTPKPDSTSFASVLPEQATVIESLEADTFFETSPTHPGGNLSIGYDTDYAFRGKRLDKTSKDTPTPNITYIDDKDLIVGVTEKPGGSLNFGAGFSSIDSVEGFEEITESNFEIRPLGDPISVHVNDDVIIVDSSGSTAPISGPIAATSGSETQVNSSSEISVNGNLSKLDSKTKAASLAVLAEGEDKATPRDLSNILSTLAHPPAYPIPAHGGSGSTIEHNESQFRLRGIKTRGISNSSRKPSDSYGDETNLYTGVEDKVPFTGDLPAVGRLFRKENKPPAAVPAPTLKPSIRYNGTPDGLQAEISPPAIGKSNDVFHGGVSLSVDFGGAPAAAPAKAPVPALLAKVEKGNHTADKVIRRKVPQAPAPERERYGELVDNAFLSPLKDPLSTFSVDVDTASYSNIRRMVRDNIVIPANAVRIEEMINYFSYNYPQPEGKHPFAFAVETAECPWNGDHQLMRVGIQGKSMDRGKRPAANLVFLLDVSGSMNPENKLPLVKKSMSLMIEELTEKDTVSLVVYAGAEGLCLPPTSGNQKEKILKSLSNLKSGGSTNGGAGIQLAYKLAKENYKKDGINRVILCTDGDFNVGRTDEGSLVDMVEKRAKDGTFLSVLGFGSGNINDSMLEAITNKGNGNYFYIDSLKEGRKVLLQDLMSTLVTIAKDVKIQIEFNPKHVQNYRLIGYANRMLKAEDFENDKVDAGEIGAGHSVTALYEIVPAGAPPIRKQMTNLKYQQPVKPEPPKMKLVESDELCTLKLRYKLPKSDKSIPMEKPVNYQSREWTEASDDFQFAASVGLWGMLLRNGEYYGKGTVEDVLEMAKEGRAEDPFGRRDEFIQLVKQWNKAVALSKSKSDTDVYHGGTSIKVEF
ncbi:MAG: von Willebrand factor type A domain-containing protein [Verrucomicrobiales bacterium]|nr:von Willebrand factor type A domain-containing protein [Verrucomicrobiales bacterium]